MRNLKALVALSFVALAAFVSPAFAAPQAAPPPSSVPSAVRESTPTEESVLVAQDRLFERLPAATRTKLDAAARTYLARIDGPASTRSPLEHGRDVAAALGSLEGLPSDVEALAYLVMMQAARDATHDMKDTLEKTKQTERSKAAVRAYLEYLQAQRAGLRAEKPNLDALAELGELQRIRLQSAMDRRSKAMAALSNLVKKIADTQSSVARNLK